MVPFTYWPTFREVSVRKGWGNPSVSLSPLIILSMIFFDLFLIFDGHEAASF